jgi:tape measure domain-containing protein
MAQYTINFSSNASEMVRELDKVISAVAKVENVGKKVKIELDSSGLTAGITATFKALDKEIAKYQRQLRKLQIGSPEFNLAARTIGERQGAKERGSMMAQAASLRSSAFSFDPGSVTTLNKILRAAQIEAQQIKPNTEQWVKLQQEIGRIQLQLRKTGEAAEAIQLRDSLGAFKPGSLNQLQARLRLLQINANRITPDTDKWRKLNQEIQKTERGIQRINRKPLTAGQRAGAAGGAFLYGGGMGGGVGSAIGGITGGIMGGTPGAFAGAAVGQAVDNAGAAIAKLASQAATVQQLQRGLAMASVDANDFAEAQKKVGEISQRVLMPLEDTSRMFAQLRVNTKQYGLSVDDTARIMEGTALAISATGGSAQDLEGAMRAVVQILSKGSVQAEELRGQLGERFPGAVVRFAQANKMSFEELQAGLQQGKIGIAEFIAFAESNYTDYAKFSDQLATAPEFAGRRLQIAFEQMQVAIGSTMGDAGAIIQDALTDWIKGFTKFIQENELTLRKMYSDFAEIFKGIIKIVEAAVWAIQKAFGPVVELIQGVIVDIQVAVNTAGVAEYAIKIKKINEEIAKAEATGDARALTRIAELKKRRAELDKAFRDKGGDAALRRPSGLTFGGPGAGMSPERETDNKIGSAYLDAVERREEALANARTQLEESLVDIRKRAVEQVAAIERQYADRRLQVERDIARTRRDLAFETTRQQQEGGEALRILGGESSSTIETERELARAVQQYTEEKISREEKAQDEQIRKARELEDFRVGIARSINQANERYAKQIGEIQRNYAKAVAKIISEGTGQAAKKLEAAGKVTALLLRQATAADVLSGAGQALGVGQAVVTVPSSPGEKFGYGAKTFDLQQFKSAASGSVSPVREAGLELANVTDQLFKAQSDLRATLAARPAEVAVSVKAIDTKDLDADIKKLQENLSDVIELANQSADALSFRTTIEATATSLHAAHARKISSSFEAIQNENKLLTAQLGLRKQGVDATGAEARARQQVLKEEYQAAADTLLAQLRATDVRVHQGRLAEKIAEIEKQRAQILAEVGVKLDIELATNRLISLQLEDILAKEEKIKEKREESILLIQQAVTAATSSYKQFVSEVFKGKGLKEAVLQLQNALRDQAITMFLDFAFKPVEKALEDELRKLFKLPNEDEMRKLQIAKLQEQIGLLVQIRDNIIEGLTKGSAAASPSAPTAAPPGAVSPDSGLPLPNATKPVETLSPTPSSQPPSPRPDGYTPDGRPFFFNNTPPQTTPHSMGIYGQGGSDDQMPSDALKNAASEVGKSVGQVTSAYSGAAIQTAKSGEKIESAARTWQQSLGQTVSAIGIAAASIVGITAGIKQIKEGGTSNVLGGLGSIFMGAGMGIGGFSRLFPMQAAANGAVWQGGFKAFANGGVVNGPTLGLVGEGKYNEAIVPLPDGKSIPVQMRGQQSSRELLSNRAQQQSSASVLNMSFETSTINGVEYVSRDQLEAAMAATRRQAAGDGAKRGMNMTLEKLQQSPSTRSRLGLGGR